MSSLGLIIILITGFRACGKSKMMELLMKLIDSTRAVWTDTSAAIKRQKNLGTALGQQLTALEPEQAAGLILPPELVFPSCTHWIEEQYAKNRAYIAGLAGSSRSPEESRMCLSYASVVRQVLLMGTEDQMHACVKERQRRTGIIRPDESEESLETSWREYETKVIPSVQPFERRAMIMQRSDSLRSRLTRLIESIPAPPQMKGLWLARLNDPHHPVCIEVNELDGMTRKHKVPERQLVAA